MVVPNPLGSGVTSASARMRSRNGFRLGQPPDSDRNQPGASGGRGTPEEGVDRADEGLLVPLGQSFDFLEPGQQAAVLDGGVLCLFREAEQFVGRNPEHVCERDDEL